MFDRILQRLDRWKKAFLSLGEDNLNLVMFILHPYLFPLSFQNLIINSLKDRENAKGFLLVRDKEGEERSINYDVVCRPKKLEV